MSVIDIATKTIISTPGLSGGFNQPNGIAITPDGQFAYVANSAGNNVSVVYTGISSPINFSGCRKKNVFSTQVDNYNRLTWQAPTSGAAPAAYRIYRDAALTEFVATVPAQGILQYEDHNRDPRVNYSYFIVSTDNLSNFSDAASTTITTYC